jgi:uncharacterized protein (TIGR03083 family)
LRAMKLSPRYDAPGFLRFEGPLDDPSVALLRQRRRLASILAELDDAQWATPSRCEGWSVRDVISHLVDTNQFWAISITAGRSGEPTRFLAAFDPVATPAEMVEGVRSLPWATVLERFVESNEAIAEAVAGLDDDDWSILGEAPPGHVPLRGVALHALWDAWIHERDITLPLGLAPVEDTDEIAACLRYAAAISPALAVAGGSMRQGSIVVEATDPDVRVVVDVGEAILVHEGDASTDALHLTGSAVELVEALSYRTPLRQPVADEHRWLFDGLGEVFDRDSAGAA